MEQESLFTASKWDILKLLSSGGKSPLQLAKLSNTSVANVSQQLRLLEMAGLVQSKRISNRDKGQPRLLYSLVGNHSFLIASTADFVEKKFLQLSVYNKIILKIWFIDNPQAHYYLEKAFWHLEDRMSKIEGIFVDLKTLSSDQFSLFLLSEDVNIKNSLKKVQIKNSSGQSKNIIFSVKGRNEISKLLQSGTGNYYAVYDPKNIFAEKKGSAKKDELL